MSVSSLIAGASSSLTQIQQQLQSPAQGVHGHHHHSSSASSFQDLMAQATGETSGSQSTGAGSALGGEESDLASLFGSTANSSSLLDISI